MDISLVNFKNYFSNSMPFTNDLEDIENFYKLYEDLMVFSEKNFLKLFMILNTQNLLKILKSKLKNC